MIIRCLFMHFLHYWVRYEINYWHEFGLNYMAPINWLSPPQVLRIGYRSVVNPELRRLR